MTSTSISIKHQNHQMLTNAILSPESTSQPWHDVEIVTLRQSTIDRATNRVLDSIVDVVDVPMKIADELTLAEYATNREHVNIDGDKITIAVQADVVDDTTINSAMDMLMSLVEYTPGTYYTGPEHYIDFGCGTPVGMV